MAVFRFLYALYLRLTGVGLVAVAGLAAAIDGTTRTGVATTGAPLWAVAALGAFGLFFLIPWWLPPSLRRPARARDLVWLAPHAVVALLVPMVAVPLSQAAATVAGLPPEAGALMTQATAHQVSSLVLPAVLMLILVLPGLTARGADAVAARAARATRARTVKAARLSEKKLPQLGAALKLYIVADWLVLRLMGLGLLGTAYMMWTMIEADRIGTAAQMAYGRDPMMALYIYAGIGAMLALPFLLPGRIARPRHVGYGLVKATLLVAAAFALIGPVDVAIVEFTPDMYHPTLIATVPKLVKAISGISVTSVLLIAFFRQLNTLPDVDYRGDPKVMLSAQDLNALRKARMNL